MADSRHSSDNADYSLDKILSEYPSGEKKGSDDEILDDILSSYPANKTYDDSGLREFFDSRQQTMNIDLSSISFTMPEDYPSPEEIKEANRQREEIRAQTEKRVRARKQAEAREKEDKIKKKRQIDYEILSGDYDRKFMPDELKTSDELIAEGKTPSAPEDKSARSPAPKESAAGSPPSAAGKKKVKVKPAKRRRGIDAEDNLLDMIGIHSNDEEDDFDRKYGSSPLFSEEARDEIFESIANDDKLQPHGVSLSEKMERSEAYEKKYRPKQDSPGKAVKKAEDAIDKLVYGDENDVDAILRQYEKSSSGKSSKAETSSFKNLTTGIFNKLLAKDDEEEESSELLEEIKKIKRAAPINRKHISDIDLNLSGKILPDTSQLGSAKTNDEQDKLNALKERREKKVKSFVLIGDEEENSEEEAAQVADDEIDDFESLTDAQSIAEYLDKQKNKLVIRLLILIAFFAVTVYVALVNDYHLPVLETLKFIDRHMEPDFFIFINSLLGVLAGIAASQTIINGLSKLLSFKSDTDTLAAMPLAASLITSIIALAKTSTIREGFVYIYTPVAIGALIFNTIGKLLIVSRTQRSFTYISGDNDRYALFVVSDDDTAQGFTRGSLTDLPVLAGMRKTEMITDFLKVSYGPDSTDRFCKIVSPIILCAGLIVGIIQGMMNVTGQGTLGAVCSGFSAAAACISICSCFSMMLVTNLPVNKAAKSYGTDEAAIVGFDSIEEFADVNSVLVDAAQLFPAGSINLVNIKTFPDSSIDEAIVEAASLTSQSGSVLKNMFYDIIVGKTEMLNPVETYIYEDSMGLCGWINNKRILLGNRELMQNHSIEGLPSVTKEQEYTKDNKIAVYLSISGQLSAMFIISLTPAYRIGAALRELEKAHISVMLRSVDSMLSVNLLSELFEVSPSMFKLIPFRLHPDFEKVTEYSAKSQSTLACSGKFATFARLILGANRLRSTISAGIAIQAAAILVGILLTLTLVLLGCMAQLTVTNVLLYNLAFVVLYYIYQAFKKI